MESSIQELILKARRERLARRGAAGRCRLGMMRHLYIVLDMSANMATQDLRPTRLRCALRVIEQFVEEFFYLNPISQLGMIATKDKRAEILTELAGNPKKHLETIRKLMSEGIGICRGEPSLQNSLETALQTLKHKPGHASREVLVVMGSLTTCDPTDIDATIQACKAANVRCSVICLAAEVRIFKHLANLTNGEFGVILDDCHFRDLLHSHLEPPPSAATAEASLIKMGFPCHSGHQSDKESQSGLGLCMCHLDGPVGASSVAGSKLSVSGYLCPQVSNVSPFSPCTKNGPIIAFNPLVQRQVLRTARGVSDLRPDARVRAPSGAILPPPVPAAALCRSPGCGPRPFCDLNGLLLLLRAPVPLADGGGGRHRQVLPVPVLPEDVLRRV